MLGIVPGFHICPGTLSICLPPPFLFAFKRGPPGSPLLNLQEDPLMLTIMPAPSTLFQPLPGCAGGSSFPCLLIHGVCFSLFSLTHFSDVPWCVLGPSLVGGVSGVGEQGHCCNKDTTSPLQSSSYKLFSQALCSACSLDVGISSCILPVGQASFRK